MLKQKEEIRQIEDNYTDEENITQLTGFRKIKVRSK